MKRLFYFFIFILICISNNFLLGQNPVIDSLNRELAIVKNQKHLSKISSDTLQINILLSLSKELEDSNTDEAVEFAEKALSKAQSINAEIFVMKSNYLLGKIYNNKSDFDLSDSYLKKALSISQHFKNYVYIGDSYFYLARGKLIQNNFPEAMTNLNLALQAYEKIEDKVKKARVYNSKAILYGKQNQKALEASYYNRALLLLEGNTTANANWLKDIITTNLAYSYLENKKYQKALDIFLDSYQKTASEESNHTGNGARGIGTAYMEMGKLNLALEYFKIALNIFEKTDNKSGQGDINREIGNVYFLKQDYKLAEEFTLSGLKISNQIGELESIKFCYENLAKIYEKSGKYKEAYESQKGFQKYSDSMFNSEINNRVYELQKQYEFEREKELLAQEQLQKEKTSKIRAEKQETLIYIIAVSLIILSFLTAVIYYNSKENKKQRKIVEQQKEVIEKSLNEKETLLREIHHRVKNNLQIISSLLNMQSSELHSEEVYYMLKEGQNRIQAMSLIHQKLYQSEDIDKVDIENYVSDLSSFLSQTYVGDSQNVEVQIIAHKCRFDFETAVPLGLIINELVSNAYKHAFVDQKNGIIRIEINTLGDIDYQLKVGNNGKPLPEDFSLEEQKSLGLKIVSILSRQLRGSFKINSTDEFTTFVVTFKNLKLYKKRND
ncbi:tetratricopeptide repeat-containing sensor histidine kinase [Flavobacterium sp. U410]